MVIGSINGYEYSEADTIKASVSRSGDRVSLDIRNTAQYPNRSMTIHLSREGALKLADLLNQAAIVPPEENQAHYA